MDCSKLVTYECDDVRYQRKDRPEVWIPLSKLSGKMFVGYPAFEFIPGSQEDEPRRFGKFVIDIDTLDIATTDAIKVIRWFERIYDVQPEQWEIFLSGKKGVHLELADTILGSENGHVCLPQGYKALAKEIEAECAVILDTSMYNSGTGKPYRQPNIMRDTGTCKRQITFDDLYEITDEAEYRAACDEPGPLWIPDDISVNHVLAEKLNGYLKFADENAQRVKCAPKLSDEECERLLANVPECIKILSEQIVQIPGATFNDIAIQLTAYAITTGRKEDDLLSAAAPFIAAYPSSSLTTQNKREANVRNRYRCMSASGMQHSCAAILSLRFAGFDCASCKAMPNGPTSDVEVMTGDDIRKSNMTLEIPDDILNTGGLIGLGLKSMTVPGLPNIPQFALPVVLTTIANALAGKITYNHVWPNVFNIKIGSTSLGKSDGDKLMQNAIRRQIKGFYLATGISSGPAILREMQTNPRGLLMLDESAHIFKRYDNSNNQNSDGLIDTLLLCYSSSGREIKRVYANAKNHIEVENPCLSLIGNTTPTIFDAIKEEDFSSGLIQRFDFWVYDGDIPERGVARGENPYIDKFVDGIVKIKKTHVPESGNLADANGIPLDLEATDEAFTYLQNLSKRTTAAGNASESEGERGIESRKYDLTIKYALIHIGGTRDPEDIFKPMTMQDLIWGEKIATILSDWKLKKFGTKVVYGTFHRNCNLFKDAIAAAIKKGRRPTFKEMSWRRPPLKNWKTRDSQDVIDVLVKRKEIVLDESKRPTAYFLVKSDI